MGKVLEQFVNTTTAETAPKVPVKLIGTVLYELFEYMALAPTGVDILLAKVDLSDGFWRMIVRHEDRYNFCYVLPQAPGEPTRIVIPSALQMGWQESPPYFCAATETGRDFIHWLLDKNVPLPRHPMEQYILQKVTTLSKQATPSGTLTKPWKISVYVDDYILAVLSFAGIKFFRLESKRRHNHITTITATSNGNPVHVNIA